MAEKGMSGGGRQVVLAALAVILVWEVVGRAILAAFFPGVTLPPSFLREAAALLVSLLGV